MKYDVIIIGAGAAGLSAMKELAEKGYSICLLEAADKAGGRIATIREDNFSFPVETGAEFIHGKLPYTFKILKEAGISYEVVEGKMVGVQKGEWKEEEHDEHWDRFMKELNKLKTDITILQFLDDHFNTPEYNHLRQSVQRFAEGFDLADIARASILSLKNEWRDIEKKQYRVKGGYIQLIDYLLKSGLQKSASVYFNTPVNKIDKTKDSIVVHTTDNKKFYSGKLIVTVSLGVLQSGSIQFEPELNDHAIAIQGLGFGTVIKFLLEFKTAFWKEFDDDIGFLLTDEEIPTWWTQAPAESNLLTGWLGGPKAAEKIFQSEDEMLLTALNSLSSIFKMPVAMLREELYYYKIISWQNNQYIKGGYSYNTLATENARKILLNPIDDMIFFAGEAMGDGDSQGTVESALESGHQTATLLIEKLQHIKQL